MLSEVPNWLIAKKTFAAGIRLPKLGKWHDAENRRACFAGGTPLFPRYSVTGGPNSMNGVIDLRKGDLLSNGDLRAWNGVNYKETYATCRNCGEVCHYGKERKEHMRAGCGSIITRALKLLVRSDRCVVCDEKTNKKMWGVPMCSKECQGEWAWTTRCPPALRAAIDLVERENVTL